MPRFPCQVATIHTRFRVSIYVASTLMRINTCWLSNATGGSAIVFVSIETYGALLSQTYGILRDYARRAFPEHGASSPFTNVLVTRFRHRVAVTLPCAQARRIHARTARLAASLSLLSSIPSRAIISTGDVTAIAGCS